MIVLWVWLGLTALGATVAIMDALIQRHRQRRAIEMLRAYRQERR